MVQRHGVSGFPEWTPVARNLELSLLRSIEATYRLSGYVSVETPAVEYLTNLADNGVPDTEMYVLTRVRASPKDGARPDEGALGLHFDLTVPFARYVAQHFGELHFPFKRYSIQKVWRGDRPQRGRFREFTQCDIDIVAREELPLAADAEVVSTIAQALVRCGMPQFAIHCNNRKILAGIYLSLGISQDLIPRIVHEVDKLGKVGVAGVAEALRNIDGMSPAAVDAVLEAATVVAKGCDVEPTLSRLAGRHELLDDGIGELRQVLSLASPMASSCAIFDCSLARGLMYYTGTIFEIVFPSYPEFGSVASGGRYEGLTKRFSRHDLPCVGGSIGLTRLMSLVLEHKLLNGRGVCDTQLLITVGSEQERPSANILASEVRSNGVACEVYLKASKLSKQIEYASAKGIPYVAFHNHQSGEIEIKTLASGEQRPVPDIRKWCQLLLTNKQGGG